MQAVTKLTIVRSSTTKSNKTETQFNFFLTLKHAGRGMNVTCGRIKKKKTTHTWNSFRYNDYEKRHLYGSPHMALQRPLVRFPGTSP